MQKNFLILLSLLCCLHVHAQITFDPGYFIDNEGKKTTCLIKNLDWDNNPTQFTYKLTESDAPQTATIERVREFGVLNFSKYLRHTVQMDRSSDQPSQLSEVKDPEFQEETLFLKTLIEGKASLFAYREGNLRRFFYQMDGGEVKQLVYKSYIKKPKEAYYSATQYTTANEIKQNNKYRQQLWIDMRCGEMTMRDAERVSYTKNSLIKFFHGYHECANAPYENFDIKYKRDLFKLRLRPGMNASSLVLTNHILPHRSADFGMKWNFRMGVEGEVTLPFLKNKWAITGEVSYQSFQEEMSSEAGIGRVDYQSIEYLFGVRHYFFLNEQSKVYLSAAYIFDSPLSSHSTFYGNPSFYDPNLEIRTFNSFSLGGGYTFKDRYSLEVKFDPDRGVLKNYAYWTSSYRTISFIFAYKLI